MPSLRSLSLLAALTACTDPAHKVTVSPDTANVLTCSQMPLTAMVANETDQSVTWAASPGSVDATGLYTSPIATPDPAVAVVSATSTVDTHATGSAQLVLATAFPGAPAGVAGMPGHAGALGTEGIYQHSFVGRGTRAYAVWPVNPDSASTVSLAIARSDDSGVTWQPAVTALSAALTPPQTTTDAWMECVSLAIDAGNPDVIYASARISGGNSIGAAAGSPDNPTLVFATSSDGGATFTTALLHADIPIGYCADVMSPAPNAVVVADPVDDCTINKDVWVWSDGNRGAAFAQGTMGSSKYLANGSTHGLDDADGRICTDPARIDIETNGTTSLGGEATEAPRLFSDGAGRLCITYIADTTAMSPTPIHAYVQCSDDRGSTFASPAMLDPAVAAGLYHSQASGAFGPSGAAAIAWLTAHDASNQAADLYLALSSDHGRTFGAPMRVPTYVLPGDTAGAAALNPTPLYDASGILWLAYRVDDGTSNYRLVVDKSCDGGTTWSGPVLVNGTEDEITNATFTSRKWPVLIDGSAAAPNVAGSADSEVSVFTLAP